MNTKAAPLTNLIFPSPGPRWVYANARKAAWGTAAKAVGARYGVAVALPPLRAPMAYLAPGGAPDELPVPVAYGE